ncbi:MAG: MoaD/ThiS family protein [Promethearchaeota archaeon]
MMNIVKVKLQLLNLFRVELKRDEFYYEGKTVGDVILKFEQEKLNLLPDYLKSRNKKHLNEDVLILLNGINIVHLEKYNTNLNEGDVIYLSVPVIGG